jgi:hypothetical protein
MVVAAGTGIEVGTTPADISAGTSTGP